MLLSSKSDYLLQLLPVSLITNVAEKYNRSHLNFKSTRVKFSLESKSRNFQYPPQVYVSNGKGHFSRKLSIRLDFMHETNKCGKK